MTDLVAICADATLDRLVHNAHMLEMSESHASPAATG